MRRTLLLVMGALILLAGCGGVPYSDPVSASPDTSAPFWCDRSGGRWRPELGLCEYQGR